MSSPSSTAMPTTPMTMPVTRTGESRSSSPASRAVSAATNGTPATSNPVSEDDSSVSAQDSSSQGMVISSTVNTSSARQCRRSASPSRPRAIVHGSSSAAPITQRRKTTTTGENSPTATLISRYGTPQISDIATNSAQPRRLTRVLPTSSSPRHHRGLPRQPPAPGSRYRGPRAFGTESTELSVPKARSPLGADDDLDPHRQRGRQQQPPAPLPGRQERGTGEHPDVEGQPDPLGLPPHQPGQVADQDPGEGRQRQHRQPGPAQR